MTITVVVVVMATAGAVSPFTASAVSPAPRWVISSVAQPTNFSTSDTALCSRSEFFLCDQYVVTLTNVGDGSTTGPVVIADTLPAGLKAVGMGGYNMEENLELESHGPHMTCSLHVTTCTYVGQADPGTTLVVYLEVEVTSANGIVTNTARVSGGGAPQVTTSEPLTSPNTVDLLPAPFDISDFGFEAHDAYGLSDPEAGGHPYGVTSTVNFNTAITAEPSGTLVPGSVEPPKNLAVYPPLGFLGDPTAAAQCTGTELGGGGNVNSECPPTSRVGTFIFFEENVVSGTVAPANVGGAESAVYNMVPQHGYPAQFGFKVSGISVPLYVSLVHTPSGYGLRVATPGLPTTLHVEGAALTFFGDPKAADGEPNVSRAFFTNPDNCSAGPLTAKVQADSWVHPGQWVTGESVAYPQMAGCNLLQFEPMVEMQPEVTQAEAPSGYEIKLKVPQNPERFPVLATPQLKDVTMTLPEGMAISPGGGDGLAGCEASGPHGIDMPTGGSNPFDVGAGAPGERGEELGQEGMTQLVAGHCPAASQVGTVQIVTPVLKKPLMGHLYIAQPKCGGAGQPVCTAADATNGNLFGLYLEAGSEEAAAVVKLAGSVSIDPATGRVTAKFKENPQLPVSEVDIQLNGGARAPLANPRQCGAASAEADLSPWSSPVTPDALVKSPSFGVDWDGNGAPCPATPFTPSLSAGPTRVAAGHFSPFTLTLNRGDRQQDLSRLQVRMPPGLLGMLSKVPLCDEPAAALGECGEASNIGSVNVAAGSGSHPLWVTGKVFLTGPYGGAPFGLSVVVPAVAGPFNLGNVIVRSRIDIDPTTSAVIITSDPLPQSRDGIPLRIQTLNVAVTRNEFTFNPTHCSGLQVSATAESAQGAQASLSSPVSVEGCSGLPFTPGFKVSTGAATSKALGASLDVKVTSAAGQANIAGVAVKLPKQLPARLSTLQHACLAEVFASNPALCDPKSLVGVVQASTPVLPVKLSGPAYLVSHGGAAFPDLVVVLQGDGVRINLTGNTNITKGITSSTFASVPDAPIESFELQLPRGPHSALTSNVKALCGQKLAMPITITGQNGAQIKQTTKIAVTGCPKAKKRPAAKKRTH
ncbi:MAG TPA: hypothetical protein VIC06_00800 [Solirubrobacteraceae bacterium]|jgi:hypothetical protein